MSNMKERGKAMGLTQPHISPTKEMINMNKQQMTCKGKPQPSKEALDRFIQIYTNALKNLKEKGVEEDGIDKED